MESAMLLIISAILFCICFAVSNHSLGGFLGKLAVFGALLGGAFFAAQTGGVLLSNGVVVMLFTLGCASFFMLFSSRESGILLSCLAPIMGLVVITGNEGRNTYTVGKYYQLQTRLYDACLNNADKDVFERIRQEIVVLNVPVAGGMTSVTSLDPLYGSLQAIQSLEERSEKICAKAVSYNEAVKVPIVKGSDAQALEAVVADIRVEYRDTIFKSEDVENMRTALALKTVYISSLENNIEETPVNDNQEQVVAAEDNGNIQLLFTYQQNQMFKLSLPRVQGECASTTSKQGNLEACFANERVRVKFTSGDYTTQTSYPLAQFINGPVPLDSNIQK